MRVLRPFFSLLLACVAAVAAAQPLRIGTYGTDFWCGFMQNSTGSQSLQLLIGAPDGASGTASMPATGWSANFTVAANSTIVVNVPLSAASIGSEIVQAGGIHITASDSVNISAVNYQATTGDGAQLITTASLGNRYRVEAYSGVPGWADTYRSEFLVVATTHGTQIRITPTVPTKGGHPAHVPFTVDLDAGQTYQVQALSSSADLTGTLVEGTEASGPCRSFAVFGGSICSYVPSTCPACTHLFEQMAPVTSWGASFHTAPIVGMPAYTYRVLAAENGTHVNVDGVATATLNAGEYYEANFVPTPVCISADRPISVTQMLQGGACGPTPNAAGDPASVRLLPDQLLNHSVVFSTMHLQPPSTVHRLSVIVPTSGVNTVYLDDGAMSSALFTPYGHCTGLSYASTVISAGTHRLRSSAGFLAYGYGLAPGEGYMFSVSDAPYPIIPPEPVLCSDAPITLSAPIALNNIAWTTASTPGTVLSTNSDYTFTPDHNDVYRVDGTRPISGCPEHFEFPIGLPVQPTLDMRANGATTVDVCQFSSVHLEALPAPDPAWFDLSWSPANDLNDPHSPTPRAFPSTTTWYKLSVVSPVGCGSAVDSVLVTVRPSDVYALHATTNDDAICLGETVNLQVKAERPIRFDAFNGAPATWWTIRGGSISDACGAVSGTALYFNGAGQRSAGIGPVDLSGGGRAHFALKIAAGTAPCDDAEPGEDVVFEYSVNNGTNWTTLATFNEAGYPSFTNMDVEIPALNGPGANTLVRWRQLSHSGAGQDNWALDNVVLTRLDNTGLPWTWTPAASLTAPTAAVTTATPTADARYHVSTSTPSGCSYADSVQVTVAPAFSIVPIADTVRCGNAGIQLHAHVTSGQGVQWAWTPNNGSIDHPDAPNVTATPNATTNYTLTATSNLGCTDTKTMRVTVGQLTALSVTTPDAQLCSGEQTTLQATITATGDYSISWSPAAGLSDAHAANPTASPTETTTYTCTVTDIASGCSLTDNVTIVVHGPYHLSLPNDTTVCTALGRQLIATHDVPAPYSIAWTPAANLNAANIAAPTILHDSSATYRVTITDAFGCSASDSVRISVAFDDLLTPVHVSACAGQPLVLDAGFPGSTYDWTTGDRTRTITVNTPGSYTATITDPRFCQAIMTFVASFSPLPQVDLGPDTMLCGAASFTLDARSSGNALTWNTGDHTQLITVTSSGMYSVQATSPQGCQSGDAVQVTLAAAPVDVLHDVTQCESEPLVLDAGNTGSTYAWSDGSHARQITPNSSGTYSVIVTTPQGCSRTFDALVTLMPVVHVELGPDTALCDGLPLVLDAGSPALTHTWNTGDHTRTITPTASGTFRVTVSNGYCNATDSIAVRFDPLPVDVLQDITSCIDQPVTLDAGNAGSTYLWDNDARTSTLTVSAPGGLRTVTVTTEHGCVGHFDAQVAFVPYPVVDIGADTVLCDGEVLTLNAGDHPGASFTWSNGSHASTLAVTGSGSYSVAVDNGHCITTDAIQVIFNPIPLRAPVHQLYTCLNEDPHAIAVDAGNEHCTYSWNTGETTRTIMAGEYGWHVVRITNAYGCSITDSVMVNEFCPPSLYIPNAFTPNGDGRNDSWQPVGNNVVDLDLQVFDRWGGLVFHATDLSQAWDGTIAGRPAPNDMYVWRMTYKFIEQSDGTVGFEHKEMGQVQVLR
ncbi:MAG: gliding motility-associated C-terminal domain-containing protein [Flavobacteriales bacterium]